MSIWDGIGAIASKITQWIPGRFESLRNEKERLLNEREILTSKQYSASGSRRVIAIDTRLQQINATLSNAAKD